MKILGLFSAMNHNLAPGGIQLTADLAWDAIQASSLFQSSHCFQYYADGPHIKPTQYPHSHTVTYSKHTAITTALRNTWSFDTVLIWHVGLLKLLPFFRLKRAKIILFLHGIEVWRSFDPVTRLLLRRVNLFLSNTEYTWSRCCHVNPSLAHSPHMAVHLGLNLGTQNDIAQQPSSPPLAVMIGRMAIGEAYKGHKEIISIWPQIRTHIPNAELWIAGDGDLRSELEDLAGDGIRFLGRISEEQKLHIINQSRALLMPSRAEGFGLVYLEAMAQGRPCLVSHIDAGREVVNPPEAGLAVDPKNKNALIDSIVRLLTPGIEWKIWSRQARQRYQQQFTVIHFQQRLLTALELAVADLI